ncbi:hypothetical protein B0H12DRAFT_1168709, partial [Mycena haematopus]
MTRKDLVWAGFFLIETKFFSNAMLASLNGRTRLRESSNNNGVSDLSVGPSYRKTRYIDHLHKLCV